MDPTYPFIPIVNTIAAFLMLLTVLTSVRQSWNIGVLMLCIWLFLACLIQGFETVIWSDNADNKAPGWCDISSRLSIGLQVGVPACSLVITRRLCNIARLRTVDIPMKRQRYIQCFLDLFIGIGFPIIVMGPFYYVVQACRFAIYEELGCSAITIASGLTTILVDAWPVILPLISAIFYCPRIIWIFYHHNREVNAFLRSNSSVNRTRYFRVLAVGCLDIMFTLPTGALLALVNVVQGVIVDYYSFYPGWYYTHHPWAPISVSADEWRSDFWDRFETIVQQWVYPVLAILIFAIFGLTGEARTTYRRWFWSAAGLFGFKPIIHEDIPTITFGSFNQRQQMRVPGHSLSMQESNTTDGTVRMHSTPQHNEVRHDDKGADDVEEGHSEEKHSVEANA